MDGVRVDKWIWAARFAKTRSAATELVLAGHVKVGGERVKPARDVALGDTIEIRLGPTRRTVVVTGLADRRGSATVAATLYEETPESREERERLALERRAARPLGADLGARPTKQDRRRLEALRRGQGGRRRP
jgi:ribosome-associated heat shock protein Hsp15